MLHDDLYDYFLKRLAPGMDKLDALTAEQREEKFVKHAEEHIGKEAIVLRNLYRVPYATIRKRPPAFYFDMMKTDLDETIAPPELVLTAREFFSAGILRLPFDACTLIIKVTPEDYLILTLFNADKEEPGSLPAQEDSVVQMIWQYAKGGMKEAVILDAVRFTPQEEGQCKADYIPGNYAQIQLTDKAEISERVSAHSQAFSAALTVLLMMGMPHYERKYIPPIDKLNKKREKNGKPPLMGYTKVTLREDIQADLNRGSNIAGYTVRPHWRRGHIRTLQSGKKIPVQPCMVNWSGETELSKNTYEVSK